MATSIFVPLRTGDPQLDRIQDRLRVATAQGSQDTQNVSDKLPVTQSVKRTAVSVSMDLNTALVVFHDIAANVQCFLPDARRKTGERVTVKFESAGGAFNPTVTTQTISGIRQRIGNVTSVSITPVGTEQTFISDGQNWQFS